MFCLRYFRRREMDEGTAVRKDMLTGDDLSRGRDVWASLARGLTILSGL